ncbi:MAG: GGDEF domain-containing protein [Gammaproteobacteria bacterium]|nr:GGDEF domain-containing protein [Gammaproteobacteria bacterium]MCW8923985.1 GGDEF domain-containing protein [Gammaproteobacteria bacterium]
MQVGTREQLVVLLGLLIGIAVFLFDIYSPMGLAAGVPYVAMVLVGLIAQKPRFILILAIIGSALTFIGYYLSPAGVNFEVDWNNRGLALFAIWATAIVSYIHLKMLSRLEPLATTDQLTGLFNRHYFTSELVKQINIWRRYQRPLSILILDIDYFKKVNDNYGHVAGDYVLQMLAEICRKAVRDIDTVARIGGEEFAILLPSTAINGAMRTAERIRRETEAFSFQYEDARFRVTVSLGVAELTDESWSITEFMKAADEVLYKAKNAGRNRCVARNIG